jgi:ADP-ribosyl-[dinitrogen reductase] hydrolase
MSLDKIKAAFFGMAVGDALGVPVEFKGRDYLRSSPVTGMLAHGCWDQPAGTWSDDSSLAFCLADALCEGYDLNRIAQYFIDWHDKGFWGAHHEVFDVGNATSHAIWQLKKGTSPSVSGGMMTGDNGNGSLMRILPLIFYIKDLPVQERYNKIREVSSITHAHFRSVFACFIYLELALEVMKGNALSKAYENMKQTVNTYSLKNEFAENEVALFTRILKNDIAALPENEIHSSGYVLHTLEASLWCLLNTNSYADGVLKAVNLGEDTDTTACVTGGIAALVYEYDSIPKEWLEVIARRKDIENLCDRFAEKMK